MLVWLYWFWVEFITSKDTFCLSFTMRITSHMWGIFWWGLGVFLTNLPLWALTSRGRWIVDDKLWTKNCGSTCERRVICGHMNKKNANNMYDGLLPLLQIWNCKEIWHDNHYIHYTLNNHVDGNLYESDLFEHVYMWKIIYGR